MLISWLTKSFSIKFNLALYLNCHPPNRNDKFEFAQNVFRGFIGSTLLLEYLNEIFKFWPEILYSGAIAVGIAFTLQVVGQRHTHPADAAIILVLEMPFAALAAAYFLQERLDLLELLGCMIILFSVLIAELLPLINKFNRSFSKKRIKRGEEFE